VLQGETSHGVEQPGEVAGCGGEGVGGVQGGEEVFIEVAGVAGEVAFEEDGKALRVRIGAESVAQAAAGAGEDGGGELGGSARLIPSPPSPLPSPPCPPGEGRRRPALSSRTSALFSPSPGGWEGMGEGAGG